jgi:hypothetical protein
MNLLSSLIWFDIDYMLSILYLVCLSITVKPILSEYKEKNKKTIENKTSDDRIPVFLT